MPYTPDEKRQLTIKAGKDPQQWTLSDDGNFWEPLSQDSPAHQEITDQQSQENQQKKVESSMLGTVGRTIRDEILPTAAGLATGIGIPLALGASGPVGWGIGLASGLGGAYAAGKAQEGVTKNVLSKSSWEDLEAQRQADQEQYPNTKLATSVGLNIVGGKPSIRGLATGKAAAMGAVNAGISGARDLVAGEDINYKNMGAQALGGALFNKNWGEGRVPLSKQLSVEIPAKEPSFWDIEEAKRNQDPNRFIKKETLIEEPNINDPSRFIKSEEPLVEPAVNSPNRFIKSEEPIKEPADVSSRFIKPEEPIRDPEKLDPQTGEPVIDVEGVRVNDNPSNIRENLKLGSPPELPNKGLSRFIRSEEPIIDPGEPQQIELPISKQIGGKSNIRRIDEAGGGKGLGVIKNIYDNITETGKKINPAIRDVIEGLSNKKRLAPGLGQAKENITNPKQPNIVSRIFGSETDRIAWKSPNGEYLSGKLNLFRNLHSDYLGYQNKLLEAAKGLQGDVYEKAIASDRTKSELVLNDPNVPQEQKAKVQAIREIFKQIHRESRDSGMLVMDADGNLRQARDEAHYFPQMMNMETIEILQRPGTPEFDRVKKQWLDFDKTPSAENTFNKMVESLGGQAGSSAHFGALIEASGKGLPNAWIEADPIKALTRYGSRTARNIAYWKAIESDPQVMNMLGKDKDVYGRPTQFKPGEKAKGVFGEFRADKDVQSVMEQIEGRNSYNQQDVIQASNRFATGLVLGPVSEIRDFIGTSAMMMKFIGPKELPGLLKHLAENRMSTQKAFNTGLARRDLSTLFDLQEAHTKLADTISGYANGLSKAFGIGQLEAYTRAMALSLGEYASNVQIAKAKLGDRFAIKALEDLNPGTDWRQVDPLTIAKRMAESARGHYDYSTLPKWANNSTVAPFFRLSRYPIEQTNQFIKFAIRPAVEGNPVPLVMALSGGLLAGEAIKGLYELAKNRKLNVANLEEIAKSDKGFEGNGLNTAHYLATIASYSAIGGILSDLTKIGMDAVVGDVRNEGFNYVLTSVAGKIGEQLAAGMSALINGEPITEVLPQLSFDVLKNVTQLGQLGFAQYARIEPESETGREFTKQKENRDLKVFSKVSGEDPKSVASFKTTYKNLSERKVRNAETMGELMEALPGGLKRAIERNASEGPEGVKSALNSMSRGTRKVLPSIERNPAKVAGYLKWLEATQGKDAVQSKIQDYLRIQQMNENRKAVLGL